MPPFQGWLEVCASDDGLRPSLEKGRPFRAGKDQDSVSLYPDGLTPIGMRMSPFQGWLRVYSGNEGLRPSLEVYRPFRVGTKLSIASIYSRSMIER